MDVSPPPDHEREHLWMLDARCREYDPTQFFPSDGVGVDRARQICFECPVRMECLEYALEYRIDHGVWGGASERERRRILRSRRVLSAPTDLIS
jgi:WhiB family redox-sensing transcriptional regulator